MEVKVLKGGFLRNVLTLAGGAAAAQAVSLLSAPINTRLYSLSDYGALGAYMSVSGLASTASTMFFHYPIVTAESDFEARDLVVVCLVASTFVASMVALIALLLGPTIAGQLGVPQLRYWFLVLPFSTFCAGVGAAFSAWVNRRKAYKLLASTRFAAALASAAVSIGLGLAVDGPAGLFVGLATAHFALAGLSARAASLTGVDLRRVNRRDMTALARRYRNYPMYTLPTELISNWANWLPVHLLIAFAGAHTVGAYSMATRMLGMPVLFVGASISEVFRQQAAVDCAGEGHCLPLFRRTIKHSVLVALPVFLFIAVVGPELFALVFGAPWRDAGRVARVLAGLFCLQFVVSPVTVMYYVRERLREDMVLHILALITIALGMSAMEVFSNTPLHLLAAYAASYGVVYLIYLVRSYQLAGPVVTSGEGGRIHGAPSVD